MNYLLREPVTQQAMKDTGLTLEQMMTVRLNLPDSDPSNRSGWTISGFSDPAHIPALVDFAILRWFYSSESNEPGNEERKQAASAIIHSATRGTYADDGNAVQKARSGGGKRTADRRTAEAAERAKEAVELWHKLAEQGRPERDRVGIIAARKEWKSDTVRRWIKEAGLR